MDRRSTRKDLVLAGALALVGTAAATCTLDPYDDFFQHTGGAGGAGTTTSSTHSSSHASSGASSSTSASSASSTSTSTSASSTGGPVCGDGVCSPGESATFCPQDCGATSSSSSTSSGGPACDHDTCDTGGALLDSCNGCAAAVCGADPYCCMTAWDNQCVGEAESMCGTPCCGNGTCNNDEDCKSCPADCGACPTDPSCPHDVCETGGALSTSACHDPCADTVCAQQPACCGNASWDASCQMLATQLCGADPCVTAVCGANPSCCSAGWTQACVDKAKQLCQTTCACTHPVCEMGPALTADCSPCAKALCKADAYCCSTNWDGICVNEVGTICGTVCQ